MQSSDAKDMVYVVLGFTMLHLEARHHDSFVANGLEDWIQPGSAQLVLIKLSLMSLMCIYIYNYNYL